MGMSDLPDMYDTSPQVVPSGLVHTYQVNCPCYNYDIYHLVKLFNILTCQARFLKIGFILFALTYHL